LVTLLAPPAHRLWQVQLVLRAVPYVCLDDAVRDLPQLGDPAKDLFDLTVNSL
jgi:hypothetical protein